MRCHMALLLLAMGQSGAFKATCNLQQVVALLSGGETLAALWDLPATWPGQRRPPLPVKVARAKRWRAFTIDEYGEVSAPLFEVSVMNMVSSGLHILLMGVLKSASVD